MDQPKLERLLRIMKLLTGNVSYTVNELAEKLDMSARTIYRYIDTFREAGFIIKKQGDIIRIDKASPYFKDISQLIHFTQEEAYILKSAIESIDENNLLKQNLKKKLYTVYDYKILADSVTHGKNTHIVNCLVEAFEHKKQVILCNYNSANSKIVRDRIVEAFAFTTNYIQIWAYDIEEGENKLFNLSRIEDAIILAEDWLYEKEHKEGHVDVFRISSFNLYPIKLRMGLLSSSLLAEEYPLSYQYLTKVTDNEYMLDINVCSFEGIGRFVIGLLNDIEIIESTDFKQFIRDRINSFKIE
ncbi:MAG: helix-turn-helix transcriptional regulator [Dysgonomonas sp.]